MISESTGPANTSEEFLRWVGDLKSYLSFLKEMGVEELPVHPAQAAQHSESGADRTNSQGLQAIRDQIGDCRRCKLHTHRTHIVFGTGDPAARLMFVGEAPGQDEDRQGEPFVGKAGQLLTRMIQAMGYQRSQVYIANIIKCRPPHNRNPEPDEIIACEPFLLEQMGVIRPVVICALGNFAAQTLLRTRLKISQLRGRFHDYLGTKVMPTYHPAYLLRNPKDKKVVWEDLQLIMAEMKKQGE